MQSKFQRCLLGRGVLEVLLTEREGDVQVQPTQATSRLCYLAFSATALGCKKVVGDIEWESVLCAAVKLLLLG